MKIQYEYLTGEIIEIEVAEGYGEICIAIDKEIHLSDRRETRRHNDLEELEVQEVKGSYAVKLYEQRDQVHKFIEEKQTCENLWKALDKLLPQQKALVFSIFYEERSLTDIAREEGVTEGAVRNRLRKIYKKLKTFLD